MGASFYRLRCEVFQNLFLSPMNTGFVRPAVATVLTACGIETLIHLSRGCSLCSVATVLTACGIETGYNCIEIKFLSFRTLQQYLPLAVLKHTFFAKTNGKSIGKVATVLTACGIETSSLLAVGLITRDISCNSTYRLRY